MSTIPRNRLILFGASWGLLPTTFAFDGFTLSPLLLVAGGRASRSAEGAGRGWGASGVGMLQRKVAAKIAALTIWLALTMTGFSPAAPGRILVLFGAPGIFLQSALAVVFVYAAFVGLLLGPLFGPLVERAASKEKELVR